MPYLDGALPPAIQLPLGAGFGGAYGGMGYGRGVHDVHAAWVDRHHDGLSEGGHEGVRAEVRKHALQIGRCRAEKEPWGFRSGDNSGVGGEGNSASKPTTPPDGRTPTIKPYN